MPIDKYFPSELRIFLNHIYEYQKGVRYLILFTLNREYEDYAVSRLKGQSIDYAVQSIDESKINLYFGRHECIKAIRYILGKPLNKLTPEEDFILGALLGYNICKQCERFCSRKRNL